MNKGCHWISRQNAYGYFTKSKSRDQLSKMKKKNARVVLSSLSHRDELLFTYDEKLETTDIQRVAFS